MRYIYNVTGLLGLIALGVSSNALAQQDQGAFVNQGSISVGEQGIVSILYDFDNQSDAYTVNDGVVYYYRDFNNDGNYGFAKKGKAVFMRYGQENGSQLLSGSEMSDFFDVELNNQKGEMAFDLKNNFEVYNSVDFQNGVIKVDSILDSRTRLTKGALTFHQGSKAINPSDKSHAEGTVGKIGNEAFQYPKGDKGIYRYARISAPKGVKDAFEGTYILEDKAFFNSRPDVAGVINLLDTNEYWIIDKASGNNKEDILLTLSWDERTTPSELLKDPEKELHIVRYDAKENLWVSEGGIVDMANKEITTPTSVRGYGFFTLATVKTELLLDGDVVIYNLVSPNGDGKNDYFYIENLYKFPNNRVEIFNRWGIKVFETDSYDAQGDGSVNVFRGYSDGRVTVDKSKMLPSGTYYYVLTYEYKGDQGSSSVKKAGYLHLETH